jgi:hypothetical protein
MAFPVVLVGPVERIELTELARSRASLGVRFGGGLGSAACEVFPESVDVLAIGICAPGCFATKGNRLFESVTSGRVELIINIILGLQVFDNGIRGKSGRLGFARLARRGKTAGTAGPE